MSEEAKVAILVVWTIIACLESAGAALRFAQNSSYKFELSMAFFSVVIVACFAYKIIA